MHLQKYGNIDLTAHFACLPTLIINFISDRLVPLELRVVEVVFINQGARYRLQDPLGRRVFYRLVGDEIVQLVLSERFRRIPDRLKFPRFGRCQIAV